MSKAKLLQSTVDPDTAAALSIVEVEQNQVEMRALEQRKREALIAQTHEMVGQIRATSMISKFANVSGLVWMKQVKESQIYKDLPGLGTWEKFCEYIGISRQKADFDLQNLAAFGEEFLLTVSSLNVGYRDLRKLRQLAADGSVTIDAEFVTIGEERIPLDKDHGEDLQAAIESILEQKAQIIEDQSATLRAKDKLLAAKEAMINRQEKAIARFEGAAEKKGLSAEEDAFISQCLKGRETLDVFLARFDPELNPLPEDATPRMRAAFMETIGYFRRVIEGAFNAASEIYGVVDLDDDWIPPHLRAAAGEGPECHTCQWRRAMSNPSRGVKIPGKHGKCTRPEGLCLADATPTAEG